MRCRDSTLRLYPGSQLRGKVRAADAADMRGRVHYRIESQREERERRDSNPRFTPVIHEREDASRTGRCYLERGRRPPG